MQYCTIYRCFLDWFSCRICCVVCGYICCEDFRKLSWVKWDTLCLQRENGGLGVKRLKEFNLSLLDKWVWMILKEKRSLWYKVLSAKYGEERGRLCFDRGGGSVWWQNLNHIRMGVVC